MKLSRFILPVLMLIFLIAASCSAKGAVVKNDVPLTDIEAAVDSQLDKDSFAAMSDSYLRGAMKLDTSLFSEYIVKINAYGANIDEYGIFKAKDSSEIKSVEDAVKGYIQLRKDTWMDEYMPEEKPKLESAEIRTLGQYVMYAILSKDTRKSVFDEFERILYV